MNKKSRDARAKLEAATKAFLADRVSKNDEAMLAAFSHIGSYTEVGKMLSLPPRAVSKRIKQLLGDHGSLNIDPRMVPAALEEFAAYDFAERTMRGCTKAAIALLLVREYDELNERLSAENKEIRRDLRKADSDNKDYVRQLSILKDRAYKQAEEVGAERIRKLQAVQGPDEDHQAFMNKVREWAKENIAQAEYLPKDIALWLGPLGASVSGTYVSAKPAEETSDAESGVDDSRNEQA